MAGDLHAEGIDDSRIMDCCLWRDARSLGRYVQKSDLATPVRGIRRVRNKR